MTEERRKKRIGVFDSGIGGLTVVGALLEQLPRENIVYFGDTARVPYGTKSVEVVSRYAREDAALLLSYDVKMIVVACNTVSSVAINVLRKHVDVPIIGMIEPGARAALTVSKKKRIGVIGTMATISSNAYPKALLSNNPDVNVYSQACPLFVPLAEEGWGEHRVAEIIAREYLQELVKEKIDTLILGCTHYPILKKTIQRAVGEDVVLIDSGRSAAALVERYLKQHDLLNQQNGQTEHLFLVSDVPQKFEELGRRFLGRSLGEVKKVEL